MKQQDIRAQFAAPDNKIAQSAMHTHRFATPRPIAGGQVPAATPAVEGEDKAHD